MRYRIHKLGRELSRHRQIAKLTGKSKVVCGIIEDVAVDRSNFGPIAALVQARSRQDLDGVVPLQLHRGLQIFKGVQDDSELWSALERSTWTQNTRGRLFARLSH